MDGWRLFASLRVALPGDVEVVLLDDHLYGSGTADGDSLCPDRRSSCLKVSSWASKINCASLKVPRILDATHSTIVLRRAATGGNNQSRMSGQ